MAIDKKLIHFKTKENFNSANGVNGSVDTPTAGSEADGNAEYGQIKGTSIVFIKDSGEIWTHGNLYRSVNWNVLDPGLYVWVDLGLPSGILWADKNVGATKPEEYGLYFAWGETTGYSETGKQFNWKDYELCNDSKNSITKYCTNSSYGTVDNKTVLDTFSDAAYMSCCISRTPEQSDFEELMENTTSTWETLNGVNGRRFTSKINNNSIFIPTGGRVANGVLQNEGASGYVYTSSLDIEYPYGSYVFGFNSGNAGMLFSNNRCQGFPIRPIKYNN